MTRKRKPAYLRDVPQLPERLARLSWRERISARDTERLDQSLATILPALRAARERWEREHGPLNEEDWQ